MPNRDDLLSVTTDWLDQAARLEMTLSTGSGDLKYMGNIAKLSPQLAVVAEQHGLDSILYHEIRDALELVFSNQLPISAFVAQLGRARMLTKRLAARIEATTQKEPGLATSGDDRKADRGGALAKDDPLDLFVTLGQVEPLAHRSKRTLRDLPDLPDPDVHGGRGRAHEWRWSRLRPCLEKYLKRQLPERFPRFYHR